MNNVIPINKQVVDPYSALEVELIKNQNLVALHAVTDWWSSLHHKAYGEWSKSITMSRLHGALTFCDSLDTANDLSLLNDIAGDWTYD